MSPRKKSPTIVGWREWISLPDLGVEQIKVKVDTGARSSALHAFGMKRFRRRGVSWIRFWVHPFQRNAEGEVLAEAKVIGERKVRSSSGVVTLRPVIVTRIGWFGKEREIELTLTRRDSMGFRMLLGREALRGGYVVDAGRSFLGDRR